MNNIAPVYLLAGPENGQKMDCIASITDTLKKQSGGEIEEHRFYAFETDINELISLLKNPSLFSSHKLVFLGSAEQLRRKEDIRLISEYLKNPAGDSTLVLLSDQVSLDKGLESAVGKNAKKIFWEMFENQKKDWLRKFFSKRKISIEAEAIEELLEMVENNTQDLEKECNKLALFFSGKGAISASDIEKFIYHSKEENVFTLFDQIIECDFTGSLSILDTLLLSKEYQPVQILAGLLWQFRRLLLLTSFTARGREIDEAYKELNIRSKKNKKTYSLGMKQYSKQQLEYILVLLSDFDAMLRTLRQPMQNNLLKLFLYYVIIKKGSRTT